jgi:two-component system NtrC family sensor kinase
MGEEKSHPALPTAVYELLMDQGRLAAFGSLAAGLSHELNNPVAFVKSNLGSLSRYIDRISEYTTFIASAEQTLAECDGPAEAFVQRARQLRQRLKLDVILDDLPQLIQQSQHGLRKVEKGVADLRRFTRPDEQRVPLDLNEVIDSLLEITHNAYKYKARVEKLYGRLPPVRGAPTRVGHLLLSLLLNAYDAITGNDGQILIHTRKGEGCVVVEIGDNGRPTAKPTDRILAADFTPTTHSELRLHQASQLARQLGGELGATSGPDGTTVVVELPMD